MLTPPIFKGLPVNALFTTKFSGITEISKLFDTPLENFYLPIQKHTDKVFVLNYDMNPQIADAVITKRRGILIGIQVADCAPILLYDKKMQVLSAVHAGWRGTAAGILKNTIEKMIAKFYTSPSEILIAIGPSIRWCCYEVGYEVIEAVKKITGEGNYFVQKGDKYCLDLPSVNKYQALSMGVLQQNIWISDDCTFCLPEKYYSYRFSKGITGRQYGFIGILD